MKKTYLAPSCRVKHIGTETILAGSVGSEDNKIIPLDKNGGSGDFIGQSKPAIWKDWDDQ